MTTISFYGSHNSAIAIERDGKLLEVIELERFLTQKNAGYCQYLPCYSRDYALPAILEYIKDRYGIENYDVCYCLNTDANDRGKLANFGYFIPSKEYRSMGHHESHAASAFYQTDYTEALIVSFDGGGNDGVFNVFHARDRNTIVLVKKFSLDLGFPYMSFGDYLEDIRKEPALNLGNLVYSGKIMGLCSYGECNMDWLPYFKEYYLSKPDGLNYLSLLSKLGKQIGITFDQDKRIVGKQGWDIAKTSQIAFEEVFLETMAPLFEEYKGIPVVMTGGCALNILLNSRLQHELGRPVFVPPNPNDCGIAAGMLLNHMKPAKAVDLTYAGIHVLDKHTLMSHVEDRGGRRLHLHRLANDISRGKIVGVVRGRSEHGARALGNRSILCNPSYPNMKDVLNAKVKNREWYRPFAPVCRLEDASKYFEMVDGLESRWMSFCPKVREEWRDKLISITHVDGTARVQTVTKDQNEWLYDLLTEIEKITGVGVLLNTSFNVNGKPILSRYSDAFKVYDNTQLDCLVLEDFYFKKDWSGDCDGMFDIESVPSAVEVVRD